MFTVLNALCNIQFVYNVNDPTVYGNIVRLNNNRNRNNNNK